jgi:hypothetical protein
LRGSHEYEIVDLEPKLSPRLLDRPVELYRIRGEGEHQVMPTLLRVGGFEFQMVMYDCVERKHVHVRGNGGSGAKVWLDPIELDSPGRYNRNEINQILRIIAANHGTLIQKWNDECAKAAQKGAR